MTFVNTPFDKKSEHNGQKRTGLEFRLHNEA